MNCGDSTGPRGLLWWAVVKPISKACPTKYISLENCAPQTNQVEINSKHSLHVWDQFLAAPIRFLSMKDRVSFESSAFAWRLGTLYMADRLLDCKRVLFDLEKNYPCMARISNFPPPTRPGVTNCVLLSLHS